MTSFSMSPTWIPHINITSIRYHFTQHIRVEGATYCINYSFTHTFIVMEDADSFILNNLRTNGDKKFKQHEIVSEKCYKIKATNKALFDFDWGSIYERTRFNEHLLSLVVRKECFLRLILDVDCISCKDRRADDNHLTHLNDLDKLTKLVFFIDKFIRSHFKIQKNTKTFLTRRKHGFHLIYSELLIDRMCYLDILKKLSTYINDTKTKISKYSILDCIILDDKITSFVLPFGRGHRNIYVLNCEEELLKLLTADEIKTNAKNLIPVPSINDLWQLGIYTLLFTDKKQNDDVENTSIFDLLLSSELDKTVSQMSTLSRLFYASKYDFVKPVDGIFINTYNSLVRKIVNDLAVENNRMRNVFLYKSDVFAFKNIWIDSKKPKGGVDTGLSIIIKNKMDDISTNREETNRKLGRISPDLYPTFRDGENDDGMVEVPKKRPGWKLV